MHIYQIVVIIISFLMIYQGLERYFKKQKQQTFLKLFVRLVVWGGMIIIVSYPQISIYLANLIGVSSNINAVILTGFILVFLIIFKLLSAIERLEQQMTEITRKESLKEIKK